MVTRLAAAWLICCCSGMTATMPAAAQTDSKGKATLDPPAIVSVPFPGKPPAAGSPVKLSGQEFELLKIENYAGKITWDITNVDGTRPPLTWFQAKPKSVVIGYRAGQTDPAEYETPETPAIVIYAKGTGRAVVAAWGIGTDGSPAKLATMIVECNQGPRPPPGPEPGPNDPLAASLAAIYGADQSPDKSQTVKAIATVFRSASKDIKNTSLKTVGDVMTFVANQMHIVSRPGTLSALKGKLSDEMNSKLLRDPSSPLTDGTRSQIASLFARFSDILEKLP